MNCIVCGTMVEDSHAHNMSAKFLTEKAKQLVEARELLSHHQCYYRKSPSGLVYGECATCNWLTANQGGRGK